MARVFEPSGYKGGQFDVADEFASQPEPENNPRRVSLVVLGMHRSGTSAVTRVLSLAGAMLPADLMGAGRGNEVGHWESVSIADYNDRMLAELGTSWNDWRPVDLTRVPLARRATFKEELAELIVSRFGNASLIVVKDPRICRFVPLFDDAMRLAGYEQKYVLCVRSPLEVAESLRQRNDLPRADALLLWLRHVLEAEHATRGMRRTIVSYDELMTKPRHVVSSLLADPLVDWPYALPEVEDQAERFLSTTHRHHTATLEDLILDPMVRDWGGDAYTALLALARNPASQPSFTTLDRIRTEFCSATPILHQMRLDVDSREHAQIRHLTNEVFEARQDAAESARQGTVLQACIEGERSEASLLKGRIDALEIERREVVAIAAAVEQRAHDDLAVAHEALNQSHDLLAQANEAVIQRESALHAMQSLLEERTQREIALERGIVELEAKVNAAEETLRTWELDAQSRDALQQGEVERRALAAEEKTKTLLAEMADRDEETSALSARLRDFQEQVSALRVTLGEFERRAEQRAGDRAREALRRSEIQRGARASEERVARLTAQLSDRSFELSALREETSAKKLALEEQVFALRAAVGEFERHAEQQAGERAREAWLQVETERRARAFEERAASLGAQLSDRADELAALRMEASAKVLGLEEHISVLHATTKALEARVRHYEMEARTWGARIGRLLSRVRRRFAPAATWQARLLGNGLKAVEYFYRFGPTAAVRRLVAPRRAGGASGSAALVSVQAADLQPSEGTQLKGATVLPADFAWWVAANEPTPERLASQVADAGLAETGPLFSIILPIYKVPGEVLAATLRSLLCQTYAKWEACIAFADTENNANWQLVERFAAMDKRFRPIRLSENRGISQNSNAALRIAQGEFVGLLDHDDELTPWALHDMALAIISDDHVDFLYSDKDTIDDTGSVRMNPLFKPEWSPEMLYSVNYLTHFNVMRRSLVEEVGAWRPETDGAQDWDIFLRVTERSRKIVRVPGVHYHWRVLPTSVASGIEAKPYATNAQLRTIQDRVQRLNLPSIVAADAESGFRLYWRAPKEPQVDLVIGNASHAKAARLLNQAGNGRSDWLASLSVVGSGDKVVSDWSRLAGGAPVRMYESADGDADTSLPWLLAIESGGANAIVCLSGEVEALSDGWLQELAGWTLGHPEIGFVGSILMTESNEVLEAGRVVGASGTSAPLFCGTPLHHWGPIGGPLWLRNVSAVGTHLWACKRAAWVTQSSTHLPWQQTLIGQFEAMRRAGKRGMVTPYARAIRPRRDSDAHTYWDDTFRDDPYFHPAFASIMPLRFGRDA